MDSIHNWLVQITIFVSYLQDFRHIKVKAGYFISLQKEQKVEMEWDIVVPVQRSI